MLTRRRKPVLILHVFHWNGDLVETVRRLRSANPNVPLLTVAGSGDRETTAALLGVGVSGCLSERWYAVELPAAMRALRHRKKFASCHFLQKAATTVAVTKPRANSGIRTLR